MTRYVLPTLGVALMLAAVLTVQPARAAENGSTVLKINMVRGFVTLYVNGQSVGRFGKKGILDQSSEAIVSRNVSAMVKPGANTLRAVWSESVSPVGSVHVSFAAASGPGAAFRKLTQLDFGVMSKAKGDKQATFNLPDAAGRLSNAEGTAGSRGRRAQGGSRSRQTQLVANVVRGDITVWVNNHKVGNYPAGLVRIDVSNYVRGGENSLRLAWKDAAIPIGSISIAYAEEKNAFRTVAKQDFNVFSKKSSSGNISFQLPASADR